jgi:creatinine amidohydrolase/Fe(II)-dependent formamide hydrolase-like protein
VVVTPTLTAGLRIWTGGIAALASTGVLGDPEGSSAEAGRAIFVALADELTGWIAREFDIPLAR